MWRPGSRGSLSAAGSGASGHLDPECRRKFRRKSTRFGLVLFAGTPPGGRAGVVDGGGSAARAWRTRRPRHGRRRGRRGLDDRRAHHAAARTPDRHPSRRPTREGCPRRPLPRRASVSAVRARASASRARASASRTCASRALLAAARFQVGRPLPQHGLAARAASPTRPRTARSRARDSSPPRETQRPSISTLPRAGWRRRCSDRSGARVA